MGLLNFNGPDKKAVDSKTKVGIIFGGIVSILSIWGIEISPQWTQTFQALSIVYSGIGVRDALAK